MVLDSGKLQTRLTDKIFHWCKMNMNFYIFTFHLFGYLGGGRINGHRGTSFDSSMVSSDLESTSFVDSDDDASSRITSTTGKF